MDGENDQVQSPDDTESGANPADAASAADSAPPAQADAVQEAVGVPDQTEEGPQESSPQADSPSDPQAHDDAPSSSDPAPSDPTSDSTNDDAPVSSPPIDPASDAPHDDAPSDDAAPDTHNSRDASAGDTPPSDAPRQQATSVAPAAPPTVSAIEIPELSTMNTASGTAVALAQVVAAAAPTPPVASAVSDLQSVLDQEGLGALVDIVPLDANESAALRVLLRSPQRDHVLRAASALIAASAGGHLWAFVAGVPPDAENDPAQKSGAVLHAAE